MSHVFINTLCEKVSVAYLKNTKPEVYISGNTHVVRHAMTFANKLVQRNLSNK